MNNIANFNMVEQQIRPWNVHSSSLLTAIKQLDRRLFVPEAQQAQCYVDRPVALNCDTRMLEPKVAARLVQSLNLEPDDSVLVVGAGSGYTVMLCASLAHDVTCVDSDQHFLEKAAQNCQAAGADNIDFHQVEDLTSYSPSAEYDAILFREALSLRPEDSLSHLSEMGRCVALVGDGYIMELMRYTREDQEIETESIVDILLTKSGSASLKKKFVF